MTARVCIGVRTDGRYLCCKPDCSYCAAAMKEWARKVVDRAPPLTEEQRSKVRALLRTRP